MQDKRQQKTKDKPNRCVKSCKNHTGQQMHLIDQSSLVDWETMQNYSVVLIPYNGGQQGWACLYRAPEAFEENRYKPNIRCSDFTELQTLIYFSEKFHKYISSFQIHFIIKLNNCNWPSSYRIAIYLTGDLFYYFVCFLFYRYCIYFNTVYIIVQ